MAIKKDQLVTMTFELKVDDRIIESNMGEKPMTFAFGSGQLLAGFEELIEDINEGETRTVTVKSDKAYGPYDETLNEKVPAGEFEGIDLQIGMILEGEAQDGSVLKATVTDVTKDEVTVDYNHPLAGKDLTFKVFIEKIV
ncbi:FKBP-type peptidyl-prolyl cis-trans isomerase [Arcobacter roscoffensis]|uniref:Peptidyl-prolyl cis-trans isomerase n=1 Tax=Arcobacter roscoffensis TaxID=2961520 RepID=A0ABY5E6U2_9BACT|nr:FKBP-type peptidyl-prolyl cis-trans isomerase [Arcobacter roscoffensis]UTJ07862.1 FKBP-type peptidyl-prolyl cis-trans isomerase [Arcobacter roscoffensis]